MCELHAAAVMGPRLLLSVFASLVVTGSLAACATTVIQEAAPAHPADDGGTADADPQQAAPDAGTDSAIAPFVFKPAPKGTFAQAVSFGGSVVKAPKIVPIVFTADPDKTSITSFTAKLATSTYWGAISAEYGVGALTAKTPIVLTEAPPTNIDDSDIATWLRAKFQSDPAHFGAPDSDTLYAIFYPDGTTVTQGGTQSCVVFGGYHFETTTNTGKSISYAVVPRCPGFGGLNGIDVTTFSTSHEVLEWATDPFPQSAPAYMAVDDAHAVWSRVFLGELGDLCTQMDVQLLPADIGFTVQRTWSNASAKAGHHPCAPVPAATPYFTAIPAKLDTISVTDSFGRTIDTGGFKVAVGQSKTIDLTMYSDAAIASWTVQAVDLTQLNGGSAPEFSYKFDKTKGTSGDTLQLTITGESAAQSGQGVVLVSQSGKNTNLWPIWIIN